MRRYISKEIHHNASCYVCLSILLLCQNATLQLNATKVLPLLKKIKSFLGKNKRNPLVGLGVVGIKTFINVSLFRSSRNGESFLEPTIY